MRRKAEVAVCLVFFLCCLAGLAFGVTAGQKVEIEGWIVSRQGQLITLHTIETGDIAVLLTSYTKVQEPRGLLKKL